MFYEKISLCPHYVSILDVGGGTALKVHLAQTVCFRMREVGGRDTCTVTYPRPVKA